MEKQKNIPSLRFPEYSGDWETNDLGDIFKISAGGDIGIENVSQIKTDKYKYPIYANAEKRKGLYGFSDIYKIEENVITVAGRGVNIGIAHARDHKFYPIVRLLVLRPKNNQNIYFFEYQINRLDLFKESTGVPQLTAPQVSGYVVKYPSLNEQAKIASFLTKVDEKLTALKKKKELLEQYKRGVMQQIFSQELRFKDYNGNDYPDWVTNTLGEIAEIKKGKQLNKEELTQEGEYLCINGGISPSGYTDKFNTLENTITISEGGNSCGYVNFFTCKFWSGGHNYSLEIKNNEINNNDFIFQVLKQNQSEIMKLRVGSGLPNIQKKDLSAFELVVPNDIEEQSKIADFLSTIDNKISYCQSQIEKAEVWKKGLLQQMFC